MKLLLAEDEKELSRALVAILKHNNYTVDAVYDGEDALACLKGGDYDGAVLDIMMPKMDGLTALKKARAAGVSTPVLLLTAKSEIDDRVDGLDAGADDYLTKPFASKELLARIRAMTRRQETVSDTVLSFGNLSLNRSTYELSTPSGTCRLANKEYQMMEMLLLHPRQLVSSEQFLEHVWGYDTEAEVQTVWVYLSYLRKKLKSLEANVQIKASRSAGYSLEVSE